MNQKELEQNQIQKRSKIQPKPKLEKSKKKIDQNSLKEKSKQKAEKKMQKQKHDQKQKKAKPKQKKQTMFSLFWFFLSLFFAFFHELHFRRSRSSGHLGKTNTRKNKRKKKNERKSEKKSNRI